MSSYHWSGTVSILKSHIPKGAAKISEPQHVCFIFYTILVVISIAQYLTDKGEHTILYKSSFYNITSILKLDIPNPHTQSWT